MKKEKGLLNLKNTVYRTLGPILFTFIVSAFVIIGIISIPGIIIFGYSQTVYRYTLDFAAYENFINTVFPSWFNFVIKYVIQFMLLLFLVIFAVSIIYFIRGCVGQFTYSKDKKKNQQAKRQLSKGIIGVISAVIIYFLFIAVLSMYRISICLPFCS